MLGQRHRFVFGAHAHALQVECCRIRPNLQIRQIKRRCAWMDDLACTEQHGGQPACRVSECVLSGGCHAAPSQHFGHAFLFCQPIDHAVALAPLSLSEPFQALGQYLFRYMRQPHDNEQAGGRHAHWYSGSNPILPRLSAFRRIRVRASRATGTGFSLRCRGATQGGVWNWTQMPSERLGQPLSVSVRPRTRPGGHAKPVGTPGRVSGSAVAGSAPACRRRTWTPGRGLQLERCRLRLGSALCLSIGGRGVRGTSPGSSVPGASAVHGVTVRHRDLPNPSSEDLLLWYVGCGRSGAIIGRPGGRQGHLRSVAARRGRPVMCTASGACMGQPRSSVLPRTISSMLHVPVPRASGVSFPPVRPGSLCRLDGCELCVVTAQPVACIFLSMSFPRPLVSRIACV